MSRVGKLRINTKRKDWDVDLVDEPEYNKIQNLQKKIAVLVVHEENYGALRRCCQCPRTGFHPLTHLAEVHCTCATQGIRNLICAGRIYPAEYFGEWCDPDDRKYS